MRKFKRGDDPYSKLSKDQKDFIKAKVLELGTLRAVRNHYNKGALVDKFAYDVAVLVLPEGDNRC
jgi:hypothetical protein